MTEQKQIELERNEMSEILAQNFAEKFDASDFEWSAHCLQMAGYRKQEWISVDERLPDRDTQALVVYADGYMMLDYMPFDDGVTHWMPLPMPPKEDEGK